MLDSLRVLDSLSDGPPEAVAVRLRVVEGRGLAVDGARCTLELHRFGEAVGVRAADAQAALDRFEDQLRPGRALRVDWLDSGGRPVPSNGRSTYFRVQGDTMAASTTRTPTPSIIDHPPDPAPLTAANLDAGARATGDSLVGPLLVALDRAQAQALQASSDGQRFAQQVASDSMRALGEQSAALRALAVANGGRDQALIKQTVDAERRAAEAEASAILAEAGEGGAGELAQVVDLVKSFRSGAPDPKAILPNLLRKLHTDQGRAALRGAWNTLSEDERAKVAASIGEVLAGGG